MMLVVPVISIISGLLVEFIFMKNFIFNYLRTLVLTGAFLFFSIPSFANHIRGVDLYYTYVSGNTYRITLVAYGDCAVTTPSLSTSRPIICIYNGNTFVTTDTLILQAPTTGLNVSQVCLADTGLTTCTNTSYTIPGTKKYVYSRDYTVPSTSHYWRFVFSGNMFGSNAGRAASITNITPVGTTIIQLVDTLDNTYHNNSNPTLTSTATPYFCINNPDNYVPGALDPDGDSLSFKLVPAINNAAATCSGTLTAGSVTYTGGSSATTPITTPTSFSFDNTNGQVSFQTSATQNALVSCHTYYDA